MATDDEIEVIAEALAAGQPLLPLDTIRERLPGTVLESRLQGPRYRALRIQIPEALARAHDHPAQYITLKTSKSDPRFFVIASRPGQAWWDFLIERDSEYGPVLDALRFGDRLFLSPPEGAGFVSEQARNHSAHLFATGSGIATMRPLIQDWLASPETSPTSIGLYYGEEASSDFAYIDELDAWREAGVVVHQTLGTGPTELFPYRFVQHAFDETDSDVDEALIYLSGAPIMMRVVAEKMLRLGVSPDRLLTNI